MRSNLLRRLSAACTAAACTATLLHGQDGASRFHPDDPVLADRDTVADASAAARDPLGNYADFVLNTFLRVGDKRPVPAVNVNTLGEVPDSSWFTNRIGARPMSVAEIVRGPDRVARLDVTDWVIVAGKGEGRQAGFRAVSASDPTGQVYQIEFDPVGNPEMATGAEILGTAIYHALGYNVVDVYLVEIDRSRLTIAPSATIEVAGAKRAFTGRDLDEILRRAARRADGRYRATAGRFADGRNLGPFRYYGTRPDDPNDVYPHEHRRELRGNRVFCAWLNHDDSRAINTLDMLVDGERGRFVKHYMFDFGSILGSGTNEEDHPWVGHEYVIEPRPSLLTLVSFGLWRRPFVAVTAPDHLPAAGNFTADGFRPAAWKPHYPNAAFRNAQPEDLFWAARLVAAFTPDAIGRIVDKARFSDPAVVDHVTGTLMRRRELVLRAWLTGMNPVSAPRVDADSVLRFENAAVDGGIAELPLRYELAWFQFDNGSGRRTYFGGEVRATPEAAMPLPSLHGTNYVGVDVRTIHPTYPGWRTPVRIYFRRTANGWAPVGLDRRPDVTAERYAYR